ncbi:hypothetical protein PMAC_003236 [Pneumocystis sp. 'macacae']|nr:hypothetical protein PMAC_003236 [Pneumocystis sp. 'macacae']
MWAILFVLLALVSGIFMSSGWLLTCCSKIMCVTVYKFFTAHPSRPVIMLHTRILYAFLFLLNSLFSWLMRTSWAIRKLESLTPINMRTPCPEGKCYGVLAVRRINFSLGLFHLLMAFLLMGVCSTKKKASSLQNGYWSFKIIIWALIVMTTFFINDTFFVIWGNYVSLIGSIIFILFGLFLLIDFAYSWAEICCQKYEETQRNFWKINLIGSTFLMYFGTALLILAMYLFFAKPGCSLNQLIIFIDIIFLFVITVISIHPTVQDYNPRSGLAQSAMVCLYTTYLTISALSNEPGDSSGSHCNPLAYPSGTKTINTVLDAIFTFLAIAYNTSRAAVQANFLYSKQDNLYYGQLEECNYDHNSVASNPICKAKMRREILKASIETGSLPASALDSSDDDSLDIYNNDNKQDDIQYNYSVFHLIFFLATCYTTCLLTGWGTLKTYGGRHGDNESFIAIGHSYSVVWMKILSSWICHLLYKLQYGHV